MPDDDSDKPESKPDPGQSPDKPNPDVHPPAYDIVTEGWESDKTVFRARDKKSIKKDQK